MTLSCAALLIAACGTRAEMSTPTSSAPTPTLPAPTPTSPSRFDEPRLWPIAEMSSPRAVHSATRLVDGRILIAGGCDDAGCSLGTAGGATAELFDPATDRFEPTGDLTISRDDHAAILVSDGRVLLLGGWAASGVLASSDLYDPVGGRFVPGPVMRSARSGFTPIPLEDGRLLLAGGFVGNRPTIAAAELLDAAAGASEAVGAMVRPRGAYAAARLPDGQVLFAGGFSDGAITATAEIFDPASSTFSATGSMTVARYKAAAFALPSGKVLIAGGAGDIDGNIVFDSTELYDSGSGTFSQGPFLRFARYKIAEASVPFANGDVLVAGGAKEAELYRASTGQFERVSGSLGATRLFLAAAPVDNTHALLVGGYDRSIRPTREAWLFEYGG